jgi:uncharacterized Fe-S center protein
MKSLSDLQSMEINDCIKMCLCKENMYTNVPKSEIVNIIESMTENNQGILKSNQKRNNKHTVYSRI